MKVRLLAGFVIVVSLLLASTLVVAAKKTLTLVASQQTDQSQPSPDTNINESSTATWEGSGDPQIRDTDTLNAAISDSPGWEQVNLDGFGDPGNSVVSFLEVYSDSLYAGARQYGVGADLWRSDSGSSWTIVFTDGFGSVSNQGIVDAIEFKGNLYAGTWADTIQGSEVWRSSNGLDWTRVVSQGFGDINNTEVNRLAIFSDTLYASTWNRSTGGVIWYSQDGDAGNWFDANVPWDANNIAAPAMDVFNDYLYAGTNNEDTGGEMWRTANGTTWNQVNIDGFNEPENNAIASSAIFNGYLYVGTRNASTGGQVWRCSTCDGSDWNRVASIGYGNADNWGAIALIEFDNDLYCFTANDETGIEVWSTGNETDWEQIGFNGFGDSGNYRPLWDNTVAVFENSLYIGTYNWVSGGEVWRKLDSAQASVDPDTGGTLTYTDLVTTTISIPPSAVTETITLLYTPIPTVTAPLGFSFAGRSFSLDAYIDGLLLPDYSFLIPISITLQYSDTDVTGLNENSMTLDYWDGNAWLEAACGPYDRHPEENWLSAPICHLSEFALFGKEGYQVYLPLTIR